MTANGLADRNINNYHSYMLYRICFEICAIRIIAIFIHEYTSSSILKTISDRQLRFFLRFVNYLSLKLLGKSIDDHELLFIRLVLSTVINTNI